MVLESSTRTKGGEGRLSVDLAVEQDGVRLKFGEPALGGLGNPSNEKHGPVDKTS